ncbi:PilW family protein [Dyella tabacisoli]|uniref:PilW family protein n=1 Tax=Dyella tabacisoli TaxID=2282381 RepID=UPI0013B3ED13|nr:PilW family protein [Dyella tabacisoli]
MIGARFTYSQQAGITLVELMVAMVLGLLVTAGIISVFLATATGNRVQKQLANLQEDGRYAITLLARDLRMANAQYCASTGGVSKSMGGVYVSPLRAPTVQAKTLIQALGDVTTPWGLTPYPAAPTAPYDFPSFLSMRGYDCDKRGGCVPVSPGMLPAAGKGVGSRVVGAGVITLRYMNSSGGWALGVNSKVVNADGVISHIRIVPGMGEPAIADYYKNSGDLMLLADCSHAQIFAVSLQGGNEFYPSGTGANENLAAPVAQHDLSGGRLFNFSSDFNTVTYYLKVVDNGSGHTAGALIRRLNGTDHEVVRGVERLDFLYGIEDAAGTVRYLTANEVDTRAGGSISCPPSTPGPLGSDYGCLWRAVKSIEAHVLMSGQHAIHALAAKDINYLYSMDGDTSPQSATASTRKVQPGDQGFEETRLRREFHTLISVRNYNP